MGIFLSNIETSGLIDCAVADTMSYWDWMPNHGHFTWLVTQYEHELAVLLNAPQYLLPGEHSIINATVYNNGLNNETNVKIQLIINGSIVANETLPELTNGTYYAISYPWAPIEEGIYNVTAYAPPVPEENFTLNNVRTRFVSVYYPLINPKPGQYANYTMSYYDSSGVFIGQGYLNLTYQYYIEPYKIYITAWLKDPTGYTSTGYMIVNTVTRFVEEGIWYSLWYPGWIETDIDIGSTINLLDSTATVSGAKILAVGPRAIDCWEIPYTMYDYPYTFWYDKASGLWIGMNSTNPRTGEYIELFLIDTNVPIGVQYEHDLGVTLEAPLRLQPGESSVLNATVYNLGLHNETNVQIQILINGTVVESEIITELVNGTSFTLHYPWTPTAEGVYNITAYALPVSGEDVIINNVASVMVRVRFVQVALISSYSELLAITAFLDSMGIGYDIYNDNNYYLYTKNLDLLLKYKAVIFYNRYRLITPDEYLALESYLSSGGNLLVTGCDCLISDTLLASLVRSSSTGDNVGEPDLIVVNEAHPIMNGPYGSFSQGYHVYGLYYDCDMAEADTTRGAATVAELLDGYDKIIATEGLPGKVVFWNGDGTYDWMYNSDCQVMLKNMIHWFLIRYQHELTVSLQAPKYLEPGDSAVLNATVRNEGLNDEANVELQLLINGTIVKSELISFLQNGTTYTLSYPWTPTIAGKYNITVYAPPVPNENITSNNICSKIVPVQYAPKILAYVQYTDYYYDYQNTLKAIESAFGPNYEITELWDYTQLSLKLPGKDILLIPDQEYASLYIMQTIGSSWSETLSEFLENGGIIILCDGFWGYGGTYGILTGAGLMSILSTNYRSYYTLYVVDPSDPLAEGVSQTFLGPYYTVSFVTRETKVVVDDGVYPVMIRKEVGRGQIMLLGFDFETSNKDTERLLGNAVALTTYITISLNPSAGSPGTKVKVTGTRATANGNVSIYWDRTFMANTTANNVGDFSYVLIVPEDAAAGVHEIMAVDTATGRMASAPFRVVIITLNPSEGPVGTKVTVRGLGFTPETQARITYNDMLIGYALVENTGIFNFTFNIPLSTAETQLIKAYDIEGYASATFTVIEITQLDVQVDVGTIHFRGELVEFYVQTALKGHAINATSIGAKLYGPNGEIVYYQYPTNITAIATGFYKIVYTIPADADVGTYALVVNADYINGTVQAFGTSFKSFMISQTLTTMNARITEIRNGIATIIIPDLGLIKLNLTAINVTLDKIFIKVVAINGTVATIQTTLGTMNGTITEIRGNMATIVVPGLGQIQTDVSSLIGTQETWTIPQYLVMVFSIVAAIGAVLSATLLLRQRKFVKTQA
ncbi:MAG: CARDB domain-containing protein [Candidatus Bathyarchaeia archaeon]